MSLAHVSGWGKNEILDMSLEEINFWVDEAVELHNDLQPKTEDESE